MTMRQFIKQNREEIDEHIKRVCGGDFKINNDEREMWVRNDEGLYRYARREGVRV